MKLYPWLVPWSRVRERGRFLDLDGLLYLARVDAPSEREARAMVMHALGPADEFYVRHALPDRSGREASNRAQVIDLKHRSLVSPADTAIALAFREVVPVFDPRILSRERTA